ncbi:hypothetical protein [Endothiovibrio diazotrophicus]
MVAPWPVRAADAAAFGRHLAELEAAIGREAGAFAWYCNRFSPYPLRIGAEEAERLQQLRTALHRALVRVVEGYLDDPRLQARIRLPDSHLALLGRVRALVGDRPYRIGSFRPDLLLDERGEWRVCEINARFPVNGYVFTDYLNAALPRLDYLKEGGLPVEPLPPAGGVVAAIAARFRRGERMVVLRDREYGMDMHFLLPELERRGIPCRVRPPSALCVVDGVIHDGETPVRQFMLELERDELLTMEPALFDALTRCADRFNDSRTLLLAHDKRMLAVLGDPALMADYADPADRELLARHVIPTFPADDPAIAASLREAPARWVLKGNSSGRGIGMLLGDEADPAEWLRVVETLAADYTAQRRLPQRQLPIATLVDGGLMELPMRVVGMLPGIDEESFGLGFVRASDATIIHVHGGRGAVVPLVRGE